MDTETLKKVEKLASLSIKPEKFEVISKNLLDILDYIDVLSKAEVANLPDTFNNSGKKNVSVADNPIEKDHLTTEEVVSNAPKKYKTYFQVGKVIDI